jgi:hypothetical protein
LCNPALILSFALSGDKELTKFDAEKLEPRILNFERRREVNLWHRYKKGRYAIIPCRMKNPIKETDFEFRIYSEKGKRIGIKRLKGTNDFRGLEEKTVKNIDKGQYEEFLSLVEKNVKK